MPLDNDATVVVVGTGLAGLRAAETLRQEGFSGQLVLVGAEHRLPYDRPPLSKQFLAGTWDEDRILLRPKDALDALGATWRRGVTATALDTDAHRLELDDGTGLVYDGLVVATGSVPRQLPGTDTHPQVHTLRTVDDARAIAACFDADGPSVVVVGAGFIGAEVAATCSARGAQVTVVEALATPLERVLGEQMGAAAAALHADHGVDVRTSVGVAAVSAPPGRPTVRLDDGTLLDADVVVVGIGVVPANSWLADSGLDVRNGVACDATLFAADDVVVAGDLAWWEDPSGGERIRIEHWTNAAEQGVVAARNLLRGRSAAEAYDPVPYFWSDQYDVKIQMIGRPRPDDEVVVVEGTGSVKERRFVALYGRGGRLSAALGFGRPRQLMGYRPLLERRAAFSEAVAHRPG